MPIHGCYKNKHLLRMKNDTNFKHVRVCVLYVIHDHEYNPLCHVLFIDLLFDVFFSMRIHCEVLDFGEVQFGHENLFLPCITHVYVAPNIH